MTQLPGVPGELATVVSGPPSPSSISRSNATGTPAAFDQAERARRVTAAEKPLPGQSVESEEAPPLEALKSAAEQIESYLRSIGRQLEFRIDEETGRTVISVLDLETGDLVRQIPSEETLRLARALGTQLNVLIDQLA